MIYLCIPAHNEEQTVGVVLWKIRQVLTEFPRDYQILVADDASTDRTAEVLSPYARVLPLTVLRARERRGYAASLEMLVREACRRSNYPKRDSIVTLQADFTDEPEDIVPLIKKIEQGADIVCGTRATNTRPSWRERFVRGWQRGVLGRLALPEGCDDPLAGFRAYRVHTIKRALEDCRPGRLLNWDGAVADVELLRAAVPHARRIESIDVVYRPDRRQRPSRASSWATLQLLRRYVRGARPVGTVPLDALSPETVPPPRPLEIERERRSEAAATAAIERGRNGRGRSSGNRSSATDRPRRPRPTEARDGRPERPERTEATKRPERPERPPRRHKAPADAAPAAADATDSATPAEAPPRKRRRRRKRKSSAARAQESSQVQAERTDAPVGGNGEGSSGDQPGDESVGSGAASDGTETAPRKRRRRGGRRGGRGRRRRSSEGAAAEGSEGVPQIEAAGSSDGGGQTDGSGDESHRPEPRNSPASVGADNTEEQAQR